MSSPHHSRTQSKPSRSRHNSSSRFTPDMAAAMLSLRWPPPEKPRADSDDDNISDQDDRRPSFRKLYPKKSQSSANDRRNNNNYDEDEPIYEPVTIPEFHEVQTSWPGFDHEPVPNWEEKYMIAKPYPKNAANMSNKASYIIYGNEDKDKGFQRGSKSRSKSNVAKTNQINDTKTSRRIIRVERTGSCIK